MHVCFVQIKLLLDMEVQRRQEFDKMHTERQQLLEVLNNIQREQQLQTRVCTHCNARNTPSPAGSTSSVGGKVTTL
jgi:hypothetical protein